MKKALVVGINEYPGCPLTGCENDANLIGDLLARHDNGNPNFNVRRQIGATTKGKLHRLISDLFKDENEVALLYFSGHGYVGKNDDSYLVTSDVQSYDYGVPLDAVLSMANSSPARHKIIILDSCFSGSMGSVGVFGRTTSVLNEGMTILSSSSKDEESMEIGGHGVFTSLLAEALKGGAADIVGNITPGSIYAYIDKALGAWDQRPIFKTNVSSFLSLRKVEPTIPLECLRQLTNYFPSVDRGLQLDPSFEDTNAPQVVHEVKEPYADPKHVKIFKNLQMLESVGLVRPVGEDHMYFAAMKSKQCKLTPLGEHYWNLVKKEKI